MTGPIVWFFRYDTRLMPRMEVSYDGLPVTARNRQKWRTAVLLILLGIAGLGLLGSTFWLPEDPEDPMDPEILGAIPVYMLGALWLVLLGLRNIYRARSFTLDETGVSVTEHTVIGRFRWTEPLTSFQGLRQGRDRVPFRKPLGLDLVHGNPLRTLRLLQLDDVPEDQDKIQATLAKLSWRFNLPVLPSPWETK